MAEEALKQIANSFLSGNTQEIVDIITFVQSPWGLNFTLRPTQAFILKAFYGMRLDDKEAVIDVPSPTNDSILYNFTEADFLKWLYDEGRCNTDIVEGKEFHELILVLGRRAGKSTMASCISNYEIYKLIKRGDPSDYYGFPLDTNFSILNVAPTDKQAGVVFNMIQGMANNCAYLRDRSINQTQTYFNVQTDADMSRPGKRKTASITSIAGGCASNSLRGRNAIIVIMDEFAFFIDNDGRFSGAEVYKALTPSTASFKRDGKVITISSPYAKFGSFWDRYNQSLEEQDNTLMFKMYSAMVNPSIDSRLLKAERRRDRVGFLCEYGGEFSDSVVAWVDDESEFRNCISDRKPLSKGVTGTTYYMGIDLGLKNDGTGICIVHKEGKKIILDYAEVWYSASSDVWEKEKHMYSSCKKYADNEIIKVSDIVEEIKTLVRWFPVKSGLFDQYNGYSLMELLQDNGLAQFTMQHVTDKFNNDIFQLTKTLYSEQLIDLFDHPILVPEILSLEGARKSKNNMAVRAPNRRGAHDDISDAFVRAVWLCHNDNESRHKNVASLIGGGGLILDNQTTDSTYNSYKHYKTKIHGESPRSTAKRRKRAPGSVIMPKGRK